jgi:glycosyltransferase involved in cell wall biosynthesis
MGLFLKLNVCMLSAGFDPILPVPIGPIESYVYGLAKELSSTHHMSVIGYGTGYYITKNFEIYSFLGGSTVMSAVDKFTSFAEYGHALGFNLNSLPRLFSLYHKRKFDLIHFNVIYSAPIASIFKTMYGVPIICSLHNVVRNAAPLSFCDKIIVNSKFVKSTLVTRHKFPASRIEVIPIPLETSSYSAEEKARAKEELGLNDYKVILYVGRKCLEKGPQILIGAMPEVLRKFPRAIAIFVGPDYGFNSKSLSFTTLLKRHAKQLSIEKNVLHIGFCTGEKLKRYFYAADVLVCPTIIEEAFGKVIIEAMSSNTPVIASNIGGIPELITTEINGLLVPPNDASALSNEIIRLLENNPLANDLAKNGFNFVKEKFSYAAIGKQCIKIYDAIFKNY